MKKLLVITYYWPPSAGAGVQRWLKFCKYLRDFGWEPVVYTPENPEYPGYDHSLQKDIPQGLQVIQRPIREPYQLYKIFTGRNPEEKVQAGFLNENRKPGLTEKLAIWMRGNLFIPDARKWWIKPSVRFLRKWLKENPVDAMVSTGPPHSMHLIALGVKKKLDIPWLADFRDPWTQIDFYHHLKLTARADQKHKTLEKKVLTLANRVVTVSPHCAKGLKEISGKQAEVITNGFDPEEFSQLPEFSYDAFSITHLGSMNPDRNPHTLWKVLGHLLKEDDFFREHLQIRLIGKTDIQVLEAIARNGLEAFTNNMKYLAHGQAIRMAANSAILLLPLNNTPTVMGISPGKLYEYLAMQRPILCIGPASGDAAAIISQTQSGQTVDFEDQQGMRQLLLKWSDAFTQRKLQLSSAAIQAYSRKTLTGSLAGILNRMLED